MRASIRCAICGSESHVTRDCRSKTKSGATGRELDNEFLSFLKDLDGNGHLCLNRQGLVWSMFLFWAGGSANEKVDGLPDKPSESVVQRLAAEPAEEATPTAATPTAAISTPITQSSTAVHSPVFPQPGPAASPAGILQAPYASHSMPIVSASWQQAVASRALPHNHALAAMGRSRMHPSSFPRPFFMPMAAPMMRPMFMPYQMQFGWAGRPWMAQMAGGRQVPNPFPKQ